MNPEKNVQLTLRNRKLFFESASCVYKKHNMKEDQ